MLDMLTKKWISVMVETDNGSYHLEEKCMYLKENQIRCKISNVGSAGKIENGMGMGMGMGASNGTHYVSLDVHYKDMEKAQQLLSNK